MSNDAITTTVTSTSTETKGRTLNTARHNHFVIDSPSGPGEAVSTGESFLAGIAACGVTLVQGAAVAEGIELRRLSVDITSFRLPSNPYDFDRVEVRFTYSGPNEAEAGRLTDTWKAH